MSEFSTEWINKWRFLNDPIMDTHCVSSKLFERALLKIETQNERIAELEAERRWIPVSEPPEHNDDYLTLTIDEFDDSYQEVAQYIDGFFFDQFDDKINPTYWQPLPQPPKEGE